MTYSGKGKNSVPQGKEKLKFVYSNHGIRLKTEKILQKSGYRSSRQEVFCKKSVLRNVTKFTGKHKCQSRNKVAGLRLKKETLARVFSCEFYDISKNTYFHRTPPVAASEDRDSEAEKL